MYEASIRVWGDRACFTIPAFVERNTFDFPTPEAIKGIFESIWWHPGVIWIPTRIIVCKPIQKQNVRVNEVKSKASPQRKGIYAPSDHTQRMKQYLTDVEYILTAEMLLTKEWYKGENHTTGIAIKQFEDRLKKGKQFQQPYFGLRECAAHWEPFDGTLPDCPEELRKEKVYCNMYYGLDYSKSVEKPSRYSADFTMKDGIIQIPHPSSLEVYRG